MPTFGSLFAGIGGIDLGLERAGWECRFQVEWDEYCQHVLAHHWPDVPRYGDITAVDWSGVERVDLLAGGFPCQPVSQAGRKLSQADERWLWPEFIRAIRALQPRFVVVENVPNLLAINDGSAFGEVLGDLAASGYDAEWDCIPAAVFGAPHSRDRVWIVAYPKRSGLSRPFAFNSPFGSQATPFTEYGHSFAGAWRALDGGPEYLRVSDGLSVGMERRRIHAIGNAVVPQVVEYIGRRILEAERVTA